MHMVDIRNMYMFLTTTWSHHHTVKVTQVQVEYVRQVMEGKHSAKCRRSGPASAWIRAGCSQQHATKTTNDQIRTSTGAVEVPNAAIIATCVRAHHTFSCPYASYNDCCIGHSNSARAGPDLVVGGCSCMLLLHPALICTDAGPDLLHIALVVIPSFTWL